MGTYYDKGNYKAKVTGQALSAAKSTGNPQFLLTIQPTHFVPPGGSPVELQGGYERTIFKTITENTVDRLLDDLQRLGFTGDSFANLDPAAPNHQSFVGQEVDAYCVHKSGEDGQAKEDWNLSSGGGGGIKAAPLDINGTARLDALFGKKLSERFAGSSKPAKRPPAAATVMQGNGSDTGDGVPF